MSSQILEKVNEILDKNKLPDRHSKFQIEKFIVGKEPTGHSQLWQVIRELEARMETIESFSKDLEDSEDNLELLDIKVTRLDREIKALSKVSIEEFPMNDLEIQEREINIRKLQRDKISLIKSSQKVNNKKKCIVEEITFLVDMYDSIIPQIKKIKHMDDEDAQKEMWNEKLLEELNLRIILQKPIDSELVKTVMCLPEDVPVRQTMTKIIESRQQQMLSARKENNEQQTIARG